MENICAVVELYFWKVYVWNRSCEVELRQYLGRK